jgi:DNA mismatch repair protein MutL
MIKLLPPSLSNQIAAGEVVERPASIVKECVENSLDAKAKHIMVRVEQSGLQKIVVCDDGEGIPPEDLALALAQHATSKIATWEDLSAVQTFGFRGEALASIASVSHTRLMSRHTNKSEAFQITMEGGVTPASHPIGTTVEVRELFFNVPARRKFLKSLKTEWVHIEDLLKQFALSHFDVGWELFHHAIPRLQLPPAHTKEQRHMRLSRCMGPSFAEKAIWVDVSAVGMRLTGWIAPPEEAKRHTNAQYCFVNQRQVRDRVILHAVKESFRGFLDDASYPCFVLYLDIDPTCVDVNVHPTKQEIRFRESRHVHAFVMSVIEPMMAQWHVQPEPTLFTSPDFALPAFTLPSVTSSCGSSSPMSRAWPPIPIAPLKERPIIETLWQIVPIGSTFVMVHTHQVWVLHWPRCLKALMIPTAPAMPWVLPQDIRVPLDQLDFLQNWLNQHGFKSCLTLGGLEIRAVPQCLKVIRGEEIEAMLTKIGQGADISTVFLPQRVLQAQDIWQDYWPVLQQNACLMPLTEALVNKCWLANFQEVG